MGSQKPTTEEIRRNAREWAEFLFEEFLSSKQESTESDTIKEMVTPTYHEDSE